MIAQNRRFVLTRPPSIPPRNQINLSDLPTKWIDWLYYSPKGLTDLMCVCVCVWQRKRLISVICVMVSQVPPSSRSAECGHGLICCVKLRWAKIWGVADKPGRFTVLLKLSPFAWAHKPGFLGLKMIHQDPRIATFRLWSKGWTDMIGRLFSHGLNLHTIRSKWICVLHPLIPSI